MDEPNLQTVPKPLAYKVMLTGSGGASGQASEGGHAMRTANLRSAFVVPPGFVLLSGTLEGEAYGERGIWVGRGHPVLLAAPPACCPTCIAPRGLAPAP